MKTCGYCGRENEDSAILCRECGQSEFPETAEEKARTVEAQTPVEREPEIPEPEVAADQEAAICPFCLFPNLPDREWCKSCGTPFNTSVMGPFESALARGFVYRSVVRGRPKPIVLAAVWIACVPMILIGVAMFLGGIIVGFLPAFAVSFLCFAIPGPILFQVTKNFLTIPKPKLDD